MRRWVQVAALAAVAMAPLAATRAVDYFVQRGSLTADAEGKYLYYTRKEGAGLRIARVPVTGGIEELLTPADIQAQDPRPAPKGGMLAFIGRKDKDERLIVRTNEAAPRYLALTPKGRYRNPQWHPDGKRLVVCQLFGRKWDYVYVDVDGQKSIRLLNYTRGEGAPALARRIYVECGAAFDAKGELLMVTVDGDLWTIKMRNLKTTNIMGTEILDEQPVTMPKNKGFAFIANERGFQVELYTISKDGTGLKRYSNSLTGEAPPVFDPRATKMAYGAWTDTHRRIILETNLKTRESVRRGTGVFPQFNPVYGPDGLTLFFLEQRGTPETYRKRVQPGGVEGDLPLTGVTDIVLRNSPLTDVTFPPPPPETNPWIENAADEKVPGYLQPKEEISRSQLLPGIR